MLRLGIYGLRTFYAYYKRRRGLLFHWCRLMQKMKKKKRRKSSRKIMSRKRNKPDPKGKGVASSIEKTKKTLVHKIDEV